MVVSAVACACLLPEIEVAWWLQMLHHILKLPVLDILKF